MLAQQKEVTLQKDNWFSGICLTLLCSACNIFYCMFLLLYELIYHIHISFVCGIFKFMFYSIQFSPQDSSIVMVTCADSQVRVLHGLNVIGKYRGTSMLLVLSSQYLI